MSFYRFLMPPLSFVLAFVFFSCGRETKHNGFATPKVLVLSGGAAPTANHYSQYLQTKTLYENLATTIDPSANVFFGAGNSESSPRAFADVHRIKTSDQGLSLHDTEFGVIDNNQPATPENVKRWFTDRNGSSGEGDTFFLFVSDHGRPNDDETLGNTNNCIDLWYYNAESMSLRPSVEGCLSKNMLRDLIKQNIPQERTVFAMSQCFSGGFHQMSVATKDGYPTADHNLCGFTAVTEDTVASGCTPDVDGPGYKGYERYFTQQLTGVDVVTGKPMDYSAKQTVREAHEAAAAEDVTKDIPLSTSEYYLREWAKLIAGEDFKPRFSQVATDQLKSKFARAADGLLTENELTQEAGELADVVATESKRLIAQVTLLTTLDPELVFIAHATKAELEEKLLNIKKELKQTYAELDRLANEYDNIAKTKLFPKWDDAVRTEHAGLSLTQSDYETEWMLRYSQEGWSTQAGCILRLAKLATSGDKNGYARQQDYCARRSALQQTFLAQQTDADVVSALKRAGELSDLESSLNSKAETLERRRDQLRRIGILRNSIGAAVVLNAMGDEKAIDDVLGLARCEASTF